MTLAPVILRELRSQSRQAATYWLRVMAAGAVIAVFGLLVLSLAGGGSWNRLDSSAGLGTLLFGLLNATLLVCNCLLAPLLTSDCIARERREGTLGLLFLTRLNAGGIVIGKAFVHTLRGLTIFVAMLPVLAIPILLGGVSGKDCLMALLIDGMVLLLGLTAGLLASAFSRDWIRSFILAEFLSVFLAITFMVAHLSLFRGLVPRVPGFRNSGILLETFVNLFSFHANFARASSVWTGAGAPSVTFKPSWSDIWANGPAIQSAWFTLVGICFAAGLLCFALAVLLASLRIRTSWRQEPVSRNAALHRALTRPRFGVSFLRRRLSRSLSRNPIGWLQQYSWSGRITKWGWFAFIMAAEALAIQDVWAFADVQLWLVLLFLIGMAFTASASFRRERQSGALELLLVCPLTISQIITGRLRGIWMQFLPAAALLFFCISVGGQIEARHRDTQILKLFFALAFVSLPIIGLFFSMTRMNFAVGWFLTLLLGVVCPGWAGVAVAALGLERSGYPFFATFLTQALLGIVFWRVLYSHLQTRRFAFARV